MIRKLISDSFHETIQDPHHRFKSWEHCYRFFQENQERLDDEQVLDLACLHLAFYLETWNMLP